MIILDLETCFSPNPAFISTFESKISTVNRILLGIINYYYFKLSGCSFFMILKNIFVILFKKSIIFSTSSVCVPRLMIVSFQNIRQRLFLNVVPRFTGRRVFRGGSHNYKRPRGHQIFLI